MIEFIGDWNKVEAILVRLDKTCQEGINEGLAKTGLYMEGTAKKHISRQDLNWKPLNTTYKNYKSRNNFSTNILVKSSAYFQSITSWSVGNTVYAGVKRMARDKEGNEIANIAAIHEFGSSKAGIPKRPLWKPTLDETKDWLKDNDFGAIVLKKIKLTR